MQKAGLSSHPGIYHHVVALLVRMRNSEGVRRILKEMTDRGFTPKADLFLKAILAEVHDGNYEAARAYYHALKASHTYARPSCFFQVSHPPILPPLIVSQLIIVLIIHVYVSFLFDRLPIFSLRYARKICS